MWASTKLAIIGADIQALAGCAVALGGLSGGAIPPAAGVGLAAAASLGVLAATTHAVHGGVRLLEACFAVLVGALGASLAALAAAAPVDWKGGVWPGLTRPALSAADAPAAAAIVGSVIMTHNLFLHSAVVQTRNYARTPAGACRLRAAKWRQCRLDVHLGCSEVHLSVVQFRVSEEVNDDI